MLPKVRFIKRMLKASSLTRNYQACGTHQRFTFSIQPSKIVLTVAQSTYPYKYKKVYRRCASKIGPQIVHLNDACLRNAGSAQHEVLHALGFNHEMSRFDRDKYITMVENNMKSGTVLSHKKPLSECQYVRSVELGSLG